MSKDNNLHDFLQDVADAIKEKKGSNEPINAQNFANEIKNLPSGGGSGFNFDGEVADPTIVAKNNFKSVRIADGVTQVNNGFFESNPNLESVFFSKSVKTIQQGAFQTCPNLERLEVDAENPTFESVGNCVIGRTDKKLYLGCKNSVIPQDCSRITQASFSGSGIVEVEIPSSVSDLDLYAFNACKSLVRVTFFGSAKIAAYCFFNCSTLLYDFRSVTQVPTISGSSSFQNMLPNCKIVVPDALYDEWISATNWASIADKIIKASDYTE